MRLLVTGATGLLGRELLRAADHDVVPVYHSQPVPGGVRLDVRHKEHVGAVIRDVRPDAIIHTAYRQDDWATTADGAVNVALAAARARLVFVSSDAVFGSRATPYDENEPPCPTTPYGAAKAAAETTVRALRPDALIARTSIIVGSNGDSGEEQRVRRLVAGEPGAFFTENVRCPIHVGDLATALLELLDTEVAGIAHLSGSQALSRHELGCLIATRDGIDPSVLPAAAGVPSDIQLDSRRTQQLLKTRLRPASEFLALSR